MSEKIIHTANLSYIEQNLNSINHNINTLHQNIGIVSSQVDQVEQEVKQTESKLEMLIQEFQEFIKKDTLSKNLQLAETRIVKVRQELGEKFQHYSEVRRRTTGILQAVDTQLVKKETIENTTEELMLSAPGYWLAPSLVALASWINDNKDLSNRAMLEALRRDDEKTSLFFALVTRRGARYKASREWIERYFSMQDPQNIDRELVVLIDGLTNGIFGPDARIKGGKIFEEWVKELSEKEGFIEDQRQMWKNALEAKKQIIDDGKYPYLKDYSSTWPELEASMSYAHLHNKIFDYFQGIFTKKIEPSKNITIAVDELLDKLVTSFDDEELPLRKEERLLSLIIEHEGNKDEASKKFNLEKTLEDKISFTQLLTNLAMGPEISKASIASQKFSIALSKDWIKSAYEDLTAENRLKVPIDIELSINNWDGKTPDGSNEHELTNSVDTFFETLKVDALKKVKVSLMRWATGIGGGILALSGLATLNLLMIIPGILGVIYLLTGRSKIKKIKLATIQQYEDLKQSTKDILRAALAEVVDWRNEFEKEDNNAEKVIHLLEEITPEQYTLSNFDNIRIVR